MYVLCSEAASEERRTALNVSTQPRDITAENILQRLSDLTNHPHEEIVPYREFNADGKLYYFTPGGFLYRRDPGTQEIGGYFCGYFQGRSGATGPTTGSKANLLLANNHRRAGAPYRGSGPFLFIGLHVEGSCLRYSKGRWLIVF